MTSKIYATLIALFIAVNAFAQPTTINNNLTASTSTAGPTITFAVQNTNGYPIAVTGVLSYHLTANNGQTYTLWYTSSQITGAPTITTPNWQQAGTGTAVSLSASAITTVVSGTYLVVPPNTIYRMAIVRSATTSGSVQYASTGNQTYSANGVNLILGNSTTSPGYTGAFPTPGINGRWLCGGIVFEPAGPPCPAPGGLNATNIFSSSATVSWGAVAGSFGYDYVVNTTPTITGPVTPTATTGTTANITSLTPSTTYYLHVRNKCSAVNFSPWVDYAFTTLPPCNPPINFNTTDLKPTKTTINWDAWPSAVSYDYVVDQLRDDPVSSTSMTNTTATNANINGLAENTMYYVHIRTKCLGNEISAWSLDSFMTPIPCRAPKINIDHINVHSAVAFWDEVPTTMWYEYVITKSADTPTVGTRYNFNTIQTAALGDGEDYYIHVRCSCNSVGIQSLSPWGQASFKTFPTGVNNIDNKQIGVKVHPNPVKDKLTLEISGNRDGVAAITVTDLAGKIVHQTVVEDDKLDLDMSGLPAGLYLLKYKDMSNTEIKTIVKQ